MKLNELRETLERIGVTPSGKLGQNFMIDDNMAEFIARTADVGPADLVVEIGPGMGILTKHLLDTGAEVLAVELDKRVFEHLSGTLDSPRLILKQGDACRVEIVELTEGRPWKCVANLPYSISTPFAAKLAESDNPPDSALLLLQKETAERFAAPIRTKSYGAISVLLQLVFEISIVRRVPPSVFHPKPKVDSALTRLTLRRERPSPSELVPMKRLVRTAFSQRRKKMLKALSREYGQGIKDIVDELGISPDARAEEISPETFSVLAKQVSGKNERSETD